MSKLINPGVSVGFLYNGKWNAADSSNPRYKEIETLVAEGNYEAAVNIIDLKQQVTQAVAGSALTLEGNTLHYDGYPVVGLLGKRILEMQRKGLSVDSLVEFLKNLRENPSERAVNELYGFLESSKLPITDDGYFLAYKSVTQDFKDHHTGTMDNSVGAIVSMPRNQVDEDKDRTCSRGLHFAAHEYASGFGAHGRMVVLKINPKDVVAIPSDYNNQKGRACRYEILEEVKRDDRKLVDAGVVETKVHHDYAVGDYVKNKVNGAVYKITDLGASGCYGAIVVKTTATSLLPEGRTLSLHDQHVEKTTKPWTPQVNNYDDEDLWDFTDTFIGDASEFPVNKKARYALHRISTGKTYDGDFFFDSYQEKHDNLVFKRVQSLGDDGRTPEFKYVTISDVSDWDIDLVHQSEE